MPAGNDLHDRINRYIDDASALEAAAVTGLRDFASAATEPTDAALFQEFLDQAESHKAKLEARLTALGGSSNKIKDAMNKLGVAASELLHIGKDAGDKATRNLIEAYSIMSVAAASYESLIAAASEVGDTETAALAKSLQADKQSAGEKLFARIAPNARMAVVNGVQS